MATFTFNAEHFDTMADCMWDGSIARLTRANKSVLEISQHMTDNGDFRFNINLMTPGGIDLYAEDVFSYGELFRFLDGTTFEYMEFIER